MRVAFTRDQAVTRIEEIQELAGKLLGADAELRGRSFDPGRGWPNSSGPGGGSGGGPSIIADGERISATSVEVAALTPDDVSDAKVLLWMRVQTAHNALTEAWNAYEKATRKFRAEPPPTPVDPGQIWCTSCARVNVQWPRGSAKEVGSNSTLCGFCHGYQREHGGQLPPPRLCEMRAEGVRLTERVVAEVELADRRDQREKQSKKRSKKRGRR